MNRKVGVIWLMALAIFSALDIYTTYLVLHADGTGLNNGTESNSYANFFISKFGVYKTFLVIAPIAKFLIIVVLYVGFRSIFSLIRGWEKDTSRAGIRFLKGLTYAGMFLTLSVTAIVPVLWNGWQLLKY